MNTQTILPATETNPAPRVSVIVPTYKTADLIAACLDSVFAQTYADFEVVLVNDGSPDTPELERVLRPYLDRYNKDRSNERIVYLKQVNKRAAAARNTAIRQARGEFVAFLDSDDTWYPQHLAAQMQLIADDPSLDLVYANALLMGDPPHERTFMSVCPSHGRATFDALIVERCQIPISTVVARKRTLTDAGLFDEGLGRCDDYDMWVRAAFKGARIGYSRTVQARLFVGRPGSLGASELRMVEAYWAILEKCKRTLPLQNSERALVEKRAAEIRAQYLVEQGKCKLEERQIDRARELIAEANGYLHSSKLSLALLGLGIAPGATTRLIAFWKRIRGALHSTAS
jgi:glycosyltransferase involved in cell wall biosynthesis